MVAVCRVDVLGQNTAQYTLSQRLDDVAAFHDRLHLHAVLGATVDFNHHHVLGDVDQTTGQVAGVGGFQRRIGQALARAMGRDEVLQHVQSFTEVGRDRGLDDRAVRLGHQTAHTRQLSNLGRRTSCSGVGHDVDRVHRVLFDFVALGIDTRFLADTLHHCPGHGFVATRPDIDHLVVTLAGCDHALAVLVLNLQHLLFGAVENLLLLWWNLQVVEADRHAGAGRVGKAGVHQLVGKNDRVLQPELAVALVDQTRDLLLLQSDVEQLETHAPGRDFEQQGATDGRPVTSRDRLQLALLIGFMLGEPHRDRGLQIDLPVGIGTMYFGGRRERHALATAARQFPGHVVKAEHHVLGRNDDRLAISRREDVVGRHHQCARFELCFQ